MKRPSLILAAVALVAAQVAAQEVPRSASYRIGPQDKVQIRVDEIEDLDRELEVADDGTITIDEVGKIDVDGLTAEQLAVRIRTLLEAKGMRQATVSVVATARSTRQISILGAVKQQGTREVPRRAALMDVILGAELSASHGPDILVSRRAKNGLADEVRIAVKDLLELGDPRVNIPIFSGDMIKVPPAEEITVYFLGAVSEAGSKTFSGNEPVTLLTTLVSAGGLSDAASNKILIRRLTPDGSRREITVNYRRILDGKDPDLELEDGDIITVKESFF